MKCQIHTSALFINACYETARQEGAALYMLWQILCFSRHWNYSYTAWYMIGCLLCDKAECLLHNTKLHGTISDHLGHGLLLMTQSLTFWVDHSRRKSLMDNYSGRTNDVKGTHWYETRQRRLYQQKWTHVMAWICNYNFGFLWDVTMHAIQNRRES